MADTLDELLIAVGLKTDGVKKGMNDIENTMSQGISSITSKLGALGAAVTAAFSVGQLFSQYTQQADSMGKLADSLEISIEKLDAWGEAVARAGGSSAGFQGSLQALSGQLARTALTGSSRAAMVLEGAGIDAGELGRQRQAFEVLEDLAAKAEEMNKAEFFGLGRSLGLDTGTIMLLQQGRVAVKDAIQQQKELGTWTKEDARITADFNDRVADLGQVIQRGAAIIFRMILPAFTKFVSILTQFVNYLRKHETFVKAFFIGLATVITAFAVPALYSLAAAILANPITWAVAGIALLALVVEDLVVWAEKGESALDDLWEAMFGSPEEAIATFETLKKKIEECSQTADQSTRASFGFFGLMLNATGTSFSEFLDKIVDGFGKLKKSTQETCDLIKSFFEALFNAITAGVDKVVNKFKELTAPFRNFLSESAAAGNKLIGNVSPIAYAENGVDSVSVNAAQSLPMGGAVSRMVNNTTDTRVNVGTVNITAADVSGGANQFMDSVESRAAAWTAQANVGVTG